MIMDIQDKGTQETPPARPNTFNSTCAYLEISKDKTETKNEHRQMSLESVGAISVPILNKSNQTQMEIDFYCKRSKGVRCSFNNQTARGGDGIIGTLT